MTDEQKRAIAQAVSGGKVFRSRGFGDTEMPGEGKEFFASITIDTLVRDGLLEPARGFNEYRATQAGFEAYSHRRSEWPA